MQLLHSFAVIPLMVGAALRVPDTGRPRLRRARYLKEVDASETTVRFWQEIYDDQGKLVETHEKYPVDKGHQQA